jgi:hypothetical protein
VVRRTGRATGRRRAGAALALLLAVTALILGAGAPAVAHVTSPTGYAQLRSTGGAGGEADRNDVAMTLMLDVEMATSSAGLGGGVSNSPEEIADAREALAADAPVIARHLEDRVRLYVDGVACRQRLQGTGVEENQGTVYGSLEVAFDCPESFDGSYELEYDMFTGPDAPVEHDSLVVGYQLAGESGRAVLDRGQRVLNVGNGSTAAATGRFVLLGGKHLLLGWDHLLFVVALLLGSRRVRDLLAVASLFTLAHSVTLALVAMGVVAVPAAVVEPLIALSITAVALENLLGRGVTRQRMVAVFGFGLLHGMGFAGSLRLDDEVSWDLLTSLLVFNVGIELGQVLVLAAAFPLLLVLRRYRWTAVVLPVVTVAVAAVGLAWFVERLVGT